MDKDRSIVLLSGGLDSTVNFARALQETTVSLVMTFDYGQKALSREIASSRAMARRYRLPHKVIRLPMLKDLDTGLTRGLFPRYNPALLDDFEYAQTTARSVWVPNRNGLFINVAAAYGDAMGIRAVIVGFNREEGATFPDNTPQFIDAINHSLSFSTKNSVRAACYTLDYDKTDIVRMGIEEKAPLDLIWSCYSGKNTHCGECESCQRLKRALSANHYLEEFRKSNRWGMK